MSPTLFINARVVDPARGLDEQGSVLVAEGRIVAAGASVRNQGAPGGAAVIDCKGAAILPGLIDSRVFIGEPGGEHRETIASASIACDSASSGNSWVCASSRYWMRCSSRRRKS